MATLYGKGRGKARSHAPKPEKPYWLKLTSKKIKEIEETVVKLANKDMNSAKIGLVLRDSYGIPNIKIAVNKTINQILKEQDIKTEPQELVALEKRAKALKKHFEKNKKDMTAKRGLQLTEAKIRRLKKYYKKKKKL